MFDAVIPGYYEHHYRMASEFAHGGVGSGLLRGDHVARTVTLECQYDEGHGGYVSIHAGAMLYGFLKRFPLAFPTWKEADSQPTYGDVPPGAVQKAIATTSSRRPGPR